MLEERKRMSELRSGPGDGDMDPEVTPAWPL